MALGLGYGLPFVAQHGSNPYKTQWAAALEGAKAAGATVEDENAGVGSCLVSRGQEAYTAGLPSTPSLLIVPQFYKAGNLYQDVPPFVAEDSTMRFTVSRNTTATRVNSSGLIESVASGVPRIDWLGQSCPALLVEPSGQNLCLQSEEFTVSGTWTSATGGTGVAPIVTQATGIVDPAGGNTADLIQLNVGSGTLSTDFSILRQSITVTAVAHTFSVYLRSATSGNQFVAIRFDSAPQTILTITPSWQRFTFTGTPTSGSRDFGFDLRGNNTSASGSTQFYAWGAQLEASSVATTYIPTTTGTGSRNADQITASGALVSGLIGQSAGTIYAEVDVKQLVGAVAKTFIDIGVANNRIFIGFTSLASNTIRLQIDTSDGAARADIRSAVASAGIIKIAAAYKSTDCALYVNGVSGTVTNNNSFTFSALSAISLGKTLSDTAFLNDRIRAAALYTTRLTDAQLAELTRL
jgi:hypothetical protein